MDAPPLRPADVLRETRLGVSVSDSADLQRLGLSQRHAELAIGEIARAVLVNGGSLVYGGRVKPSGFTQFLMHEVRRYGRNPGALILCLAAPEHRKLSRAELDTLDRELGSRGTVVCLDESGTPIKAILRTKAPSADPIQDQPTRQASYTSLRRYLGEVTNARVILGGQLAAFQGAMPGLIEEAITAVRSSQPLFVAGGFGGAAALVAHALAIDNLRWAPNGFPARPADNRIDESIQQLKSTADRSQWTVARCGLTLAERQQLAASHRPREIASLLVRGLTRIARKSREKQSPINCS